MSRILKFYLAAILSFGTAAFLLAFYGWHGRADTGTASSLLTDWAIMCAVTGIVLLVAYTPIQWLSSWLKRPWLAYAGSALVVPIIFLLDNLEFGAGLDYTKAYLISRLQETWGFYLAVLLFGLLFTLAYQRWYDKKA